MDLSPEELTREVQATGFASEPLEKALHLLSLLDHLNRHATLEGHLALKGGTAINLFYLNAPRLSVDIDLNYLGPVDRESMLAARPLVEGAIRSVCAQEGIAPRPTPDQHAGGKWSLSYTTSAGSSSNLALDINYLYRTPLWPCVIATSRLPGTDRTARARVLDPHELTAGKLTALLARGAPRDVYDARALLARPGLDPAKLRLAFVVYGGMSRVDWRTVSPANVTLDPRDLRTQLLPVMRRTDLPPKRELRDWVEKLVKDCRERLSVVLPLRPAEKEFLRQLNDEGVIAPELITASPAMRAKISKHPWLQWKAQNVREHIDARSRDR